MKTALITGVTGQDGTYLSQLLLEKGYTVHGLRVFGDLREPDPRVILHYGDLTDATNLIRIVHEVRPDEIYNLAAQSQVAVSFETPEYTANADALGVLRLLEAIRICGLAEQTRFFQASSSDMFGKAVERPQRETTPFYPRSPYAAAKAYAHWITVNYRESYRIYACSGILYNHESPLRGDTFVTRKITRTLSRVKVGLEQCLYLGNMDAQRDWGHSKDYVRAEWMMLQQPNPEDYVIASGQLHSVRDFVTAAAAALDISLEWRGQDVAETGLDTATGQTIVRIDERFFRPVEPQSLVGDTTKARRQLGWQPEIGFNELVKEMVAVDLPLAQAAARQQ